MPSPNEVAVYDAITNAGVRISEELAKDLGTQIDENDQEYRAHERRVSDLLLKGTPPTHPDVMAAADMAARAKIKMSGLSAQLRTAYSAKMSATETAPPDTWG